MNIKLGIGKSDFRDLIESGDYYVDKTNLLYELVNDTDNKVTLFTRPRRFGKTLMLSMMENFFSNRLDSKEIFEGRDITKHGEFCEKWMNQYPVLFVSFKDVEASNFNDAYEMLCLKLAEICRKFADVMDAFADKEGLESFKRLKSESGKISDIKNSLKVLTHILSLVYGKKVILLIDEYDVPLARASENDTAENQYYQKMLDIMGGIMSTALKDNEYLQFAVITGCLRIAKESIFTGTNNFASYSVIDVEFSDYFGFSSDEVNLLLKACGRGDKAEVIREWYDGYIFGDSYVYCPWDVINYISALKKRADAKPKNYWKNTSHNGILLTFVKRTDFNVSGKFEILLNSGTITQTITDGLTYDNLHSSEDNLWSVLLMTGYITKADPDEEGETVSLRIPNKEISSIFEDTVARFFVETVNTGTVKGLIDAMWQSDEADATEIASNLLWETISYNDYHEDYYHAFLTGIFVGRGYEVESNKERGLGRPDIVLKDKRNRRAIIVEAKKSMKESDMPRDCIKAINQIKDMKYDKDNTLYGYAQILCCGIAFFRKQAMVKLM